MSLSITILMLKLPTFVLSWLVRHIPLNNLSSSNPTVHCCPGLSGALGHTELVYIKRQKSVLIAYKTAIQMTTTFIRIRLSIPEEWVSKSWMTISLSLQPGSRLYLRRQRKTPCPFCNYASSDSVPNYKYISAFHSSYILLTWTRDCYYIIHNMILNNFQSRFKQKCVTLGLYYLWA